MKTAAIAKLKATLSEYPDCVRSGEEVLVTDRGKPIAKITPVAGGLRDDTKRSQLVRRGIIRPGKGSASCDLIKNLPAANVSQEAVRRVVEQEREDRA